MRIFTAVEIENRETLSRIIEFKNKLTACFRGRGLKPVEDENIHITLRFIGEVNDSALPDIERCVKKVSTYAPFEISVKGVGAFPNVSRPRVIWVGIEEGGELLKALRQAMEPCLRPYAKPDRTSFVPHITVGRVKGRPDPGCLKQLLEEFEGTVFGRSSVTEVKLKRSFLRPTGPIYADVLTVRLRG
ncbi:MAG: RNA 2',3'-cyclic phosphodiesterase [Desulfurococcales archaeon]|nr:RNA 2',3'-cyclic phosphodiesterase [Desulfurococcales archaeon]